MSPDDTSMLPQMQEAGSPKRPACRQCRARKVKCDRRDSGCVRCERLSLSCSYAAADSLVIPDDQDSSQGQGLTQAGTKRRRTVQACKSCRMTKAKCSGNYPCRRCESHGQECVFPHGRSGIPDQGSDALMSPASTRIELQESVHSPSITTVTPEVEASIARPFGLEPREAIRDHVHAYFDQGEFIDCLFLHRATVLAEWSQGTLDANLLKAICALGIRLTSSEDPASACVWIDEVQQALVTRIGDMSIPNLQALMLVIHFRSMLKFSGDVWVLLSIAARVAFTKRLNYERPAGDAVRQESLRRLMWSIYRFDRIFSGGIEDLTVCPTHRLHMRLPNSHRNFQLGLGSRMEFLRVKGDDGAEMNVLAYLMRMLDLRDAILRYTRRVILDGSSPYPSRDQLRSLDQQLMSFKDSLPEELKLDAKRLMIMCHSEDARTYIVLHTLLYLCRCDLFRFLIPGIRESVSAEALEQTPRAYIDYCQQRCLESAVWSCEFWSQIYHSETRRPVESSTLAIALYQCTKIIDHLCFLLPPEGGHSLPQLKQKLAKAVSIASTTGQKIEWIGQCITDVEKLIPRLGMRPRLSDAPPRLPGIVTAQERVHRRSKHAFAPEDEEDVDPAVNPLRLNMDETWTANTSTPGGTTHSEAWPFSIADHQETAAQPGGENILGSQFFVDGAVQYDVANSGPPFEDRDARFPIDPFDFQIHAYTDADIPQFLDEIAQ
ncbi:hypothetical protein B0T10DRAFT_42079 [Thelonectria olida]|uniref:Zn(2)-C6 fungal-type domain-containing protein n=1 Tax=Thelonectria olida TaxID=1576542 RepID=A0A9P8W591_9HYPO|nr:hypothetical protein B0T10DRAFT_42079 [Thelonectria olida]